MYGVPSMNCYGVSEQCVELAIVHRFQARRCGSMGSCAAERVGRDPRISGDSLNDMHWLHSLRDGSIYLAPKHKYQLPHSVYYSLCPC